MSDARSLAPRLRACDALEAKYAANISPLVALLVPFCRPHTQVYAVEYGGVVECMFGVTSLGKSENVHVGCPWLLSSDEFTRHRRELVVYAPEWMGRIANGFDVLENHIYAGNESHLRWLRHYGFTLVRYYDEFGPFKKPFWKFRKHIHTLGARSAPY